MRINTVHIGLKQGETHHTSVDNIPLNTKGLSSWEKRSKAPDHFTVRVLEVGQDGKANIQITTGPAYFRILKQVEGSSTEVHHQETTPASTRIFPTSVEAGSKLTVYKKNGDSGPGESVITYTINEVNSHVSINVSSRESLVLI